MSYSEGSMVLAAVLWGVSYLFMKEGLAALPLFSLIGLRFGIAFLIGAVFLSKRWKRLRKEELQASMVLGGLLFLTIFFITLGVRYTSAANASFLCGTAVILVPVLTALLNREKPGGALLVKALLVLVGIGLLCFGTAISTGGGDLLCFVGAIFRSLQILAAERYCKAGDTKTIGVLQLGWVAVLAFVIGLVVEPHRLPSEAVAWLSLLALAVLCTAVGFILQIVAQEFVKPSRLALIFALEPLTTLIVSLLLTGQVITVKQLCGAALILMGIAGNRKSSISTEKEDK